MSPTAMLRKILCADSGWAHAPHGTRSARRAFGCRPLAASKISARASSGSESSTRTTATRSCRCLAPCSVLKASSGSSSPRTRKSAPNARCSSPSSFLVDAHPRRPPTAAAGHPLSDGHDTRLVPWNPSSFALGVVQVRIARPTREGYRVACRPRRMLRRGACLLA